MKLILTKTKLSNESSSLLKNLESVKSSIKSTSESNDSNESNESNGFYESNE